METKYKNYKWIAAIIFAFLFGLTWRVECRPSYYECRGFVSITQKLLDVEWMYTWAAPGFCEKYPDEWHINRGRIWYPWITDKDYLTYRKLHESSP